MDGLCGRRVVLGLSGGVDSAVAARLLQDQGYLVEGLYLDVGNPDAQRDAIQTAQWLDIGLRIDDVRFQLEQCVCEPFQQAYLQGRTPNPCILCNPAMKFERLCAYADEIGAKYIATGHYVRTRDGMLFKGHPANDQSYMLCRLKRGQAERFLAPLGEYEKSQVRAMADQMGIPVAKKPDSMEICFIQDGDYVAWLSKRCALPGPGRILRNGEVIGEHQGIFRWTVGQRLPGLYDERKLYVAAIDAKENTLIAALWEELFKTEVNVCGMRWLIDAPTEPLRGSVRVRHTKWENPDCTVICEGDHARILCDSPVRAPAKGQAAAIYQDDRLLGGGWIE